jgi:hypothetical protein
MTEKESALYSHYIIDGVRMDMTPADLLEECMEYEDSEFQSGFNDIIDESTEPPLSSFEYEDDKEHEYLQQTLASSVEEREFRMLYPEHFTKLQIAKALLSRLWSEGHFKLGNLKLWAQWEWNTRPLGNMAAFYRSVEATSQYIYGLGVNLEDYLFIEGDEGSNVKFFSWLDEEFEDIMGETTEPYPCALRLVDNGWISGTKCYKECYIAIPINSHSREIAADFLLYLLSKQP